MKKMLIELEFEYDEDIYGLFHEQTTEDYIKTKIIKAILGIAGLHVSKEKGYFSRLKNPKIKGFYPKPEKIVKFDIAKRLESDFIDNEYTKKAEDRDQKFWKKWKENTKIMEESFL